MQDYTYSVFSIAAIAIHLIFNFDLLAGRGAGTAHGARYRGFLFGVLAYYVADAVWGILAGLGWLRPLYVETVFFFLSLVVFVFMWSRFAISYLDFGRWETRIVSWFGYALLAFNAVALALNPFNGCMYHSDAQGVYRTGCMRDPVFCLLVAFTLLTAAFVLAKVLASHGSVRRRSMMVFMFSVVIAAANVLQVVWPLTPFTSLGCLVGTCFLHVFVVQDEQAAKHAAELEGALARASAAERARGIFFSIVSRDIRTSGTAVLQLVNNVLDLAKMDAGKMAFRLEPARLSRIADEVFSSFRAAAVGKGVGLVNRTSKVPVVFLDVHRFRQILFNLVGNAVKFTERGSVTVSASYDMETLEVSVSDTGCGIAPDRLASVLDPFAQAHEQGRAADFSAGTGLGLYICKCLVEAMGGRLAVESTPGKGSSFMIRMPNVIAVGDTSRA